MFERGMLGKGIEALRKIGGGELIAIRVSYPDTRASINVPVGEPVLKAIDPSTVAPRLDTATQEFLDHPLVKAILDQVGLLNEFRDPAEHEAFLHGAQANVRRKILNEHLTRTLNPHKGLPFFTPSQVETLRRSLPEPTFVKTRNMTEDERRQRDRQNAIENAAIDVTNAALFRDLGSNGKIIFDTNLGDAFFWKVLQPQEPLELDLSALKAAARIAIDLKVKEGAIRHLRETRS